MPLININEIVDYIWERIEASGILIKDSDIMEISLNQISEDLGYSEIELIRKMNYILDEFKRQYVDSVADIEFLIDNIVIEV